MCGLIGFSSKEPFDLLKIRTLIYINAIERGEDATGLYSPLNGIKKSLLKGSEFVSSNYTGNKFIEDTILMAHVRAKTVGISNIENTHPFKRGKWILEHNGTLKNHWPLLYNYGLKSADYNVDSDIICGVIEKENSLDVLSEIDGAAAFIIHNTDNPNRLYVFRNKERPLFKGFIGASMYMSSIKESLELIQCTNIKEFKEDKLYTIEDGSILSQETIKNIPYKYSTNNNSYSFDDEDKYLDKFVNCWLRANINLDFASYKYKLKKDQYYLIKEHRKGWFKVFDPHTKLIEEIYNSNFNKSDLLSKGSFVKAKFQIHRSGDEKHIHCEEGDVLTLYNVDENLAYLFNIEKKEKFNANKEWFVKLTDEERSEHMIKIKGLFNREENEDLEKNSHLRVISNEESEEEVINEEENDYYYELLADHFDIMEQKLDSLNKVLETESLDPSIKLLVIDLLNLNFNAKKTFLDEFEQIEDELKD